MANATKYVDNVNGNNANTGDSEAQAYADIPTALSACSGGGNVIYIQAGSPYTLTSTLAPTMKGNTTNGRNRIEGYTTTPGAMDGRPIITTATNSTRLWTPNDADYLDFYHLSMSNTASTRAAACENGSGNTSPLYFYDCIFDGFTAVSTAFLTTNYRFKYCEIKNCTTGGILFTGGTVYLYGCSIHNNTGSGLNPSGSNLYVKNCLIYDNSSYGINDSTTAAGRTLHLMDSVIVGNGNSGLRIASAASNTGTIIVLNNIFGDNGGWNIECADVSDPLDSPINDNNFFFTSTSGDLSGWPAGRENVDSGTLSDPFVNSSTGNFTLNNTAGAGALIRALGFPKVLAGVTNYNDGGAYQHQDSGGGSSIKGMRIMGG
jgi:hypothetical protein